MFEHTHLIDVNHFPKCDFLFKQSLSKAELSGIRPWTGYVDRLNSLGLDHNLMFLKLDQDKAFRVYLGPNLKF